DPVQGARYDVLLCRVYRPGEGFHPIRPRSRPRRQPERCLHHFVSHPPKEKGIGLLEVLDRVTMQLFVCGNCTMIAAPVQSDVDGIPQGSHYARVPPMGWHAPSCGDHRHSTRGKAIAALALQSVESFHGGNTRSKSHRECHESE